MLAFGGRAAFTGQFMSADRVVGGVEHWQSGPDFFPPGVQGRAKGSGAFRFACGEVGGFGDVFGEVVKFGVIVFKKLD